MDYAGMVGPWVYHGWHSGRWPKLNGARPSGHSGAQRLAVRMGKWRGRRGAVGELLTGAQTATRRRRIGGGALGPSGDSARAIESRRRRTRGMESFTEVGDTFL
jgi:hypothetical protein